MSVARVQISLSRSDYNLIVNHDLEGATASHPELIAVLQYIQAAVAAGAEIAQGRTATTPPGKRKSGLPHALRPEDIAQWEGRFRRHAPAAAPDECWPWQGRLDKNGYARFSVRDAGRPRDFTAHRMAWVFATGQAIGEGLTIDHLCRNKGCVNANHLEIVSHAENIRRKPLKRRERSWGNPANQRTCTTCGSVFHRSYINYHVCR